jgi:hypothetical protein
MAATKAEGSTLSVFLVGLTMGCAGLAFADTGVGKLAGIAGAVLLIISFVAAAKIKPQEGKPAQPKQVSGLRILGILLALGGWLIVLGGLHMTTSVGGRLISTLVGMAVTLGGIIYCLAKAGSENAIWKV